jgi:mono/diheme cytochrome c family protein
LRLLTRLAAALALGGIFACAAGLPSVTVRDAQIAGVSLHQLRSGRDRYVAKCSGCHRLYSPAEYDDDVWRFQVDDMTDKAKLTDDDVAAILTYLTALNRDETSEVASLRAE